MGDKKKVVYISGAITGVPKYWEAFERAEDDLTALGYIPLSPARLPQGMTNEQYTRIDLAMIGSADAVLFLPRWSESDGATLERDYCDYTGKPVVLLKEFDATGVHRNPAEVRLAWLKNDLEEVLGK